MVSAPRNTVAAGVQQPVGEDVAALEIAAELDFVDGEERRADADRHGLDGADVVLRAGRDDLLLAGDQRHRPGTFEADDLVVDLARQKAQRQPDHAGLVGQHPLYGKMGFAGVGGT